ncbi:MAG: phage antirepressor KilAC domain-containing protein [Deltaproteobacteria bacterium]|nr:phage antirepressor KilAC domain-containing protein [Deltaproteobacteria bacterium]
MAKQVLFSQALIEAHKIMEAEQAQNKALTTKIQIDAPKVEFAENLLASDHDFHVNEMAHELTQRVVKIGGKRLYEVFRDELKWCQAQ